MKQLSASGRQPAREVFIGREKLQPFPGFRSLFINVHEVIPGRESS